MPDCWNFAGLISTTTGYGVVWNPTLRKQVSAHRVMYEFFKGDVPAKWHVDHLCRNRACVNPDHLEAVTMQENLRRSPIWCGNKTHCKNGHKFTPENTYQRKDRPQRGCRTCRAQSVKRHLARKRG